MRSASPPIRLLTTIAFVLVIAALSLVPGNPKPGDSAFVWAIAKVPSLLQNVMHVILYGALTVAWVWTLVVVQPNRTRLRFSAAAIVVTLGAALEAGQLIVPGRFGSMADVLLNTFGVMMGIIVASRLIDR
jgi:VanZ family protein